MIHPIAGGPVSRACPEPAEEEPASPAAEEADAPQPTPDGHGIVTVGALVREARLPAEAGGDRVLTARGAVKLVIGLGIWGLAALGLGSLLG